MRNGKFAGLPEAVREEVNRRLNEGQRGDLILPWLNGLPEVRAVLDARFGGRPLSNSNLCHWRRGGHQDWREERRTRAVAESLAELAIHHAKTDGATGLATGAAATLGMVLAEAGKQMYREEDSPRERANKILLATRGLTALRWAVSRQEREEELERKVKLLQVKSCLERARHELLVRNLKTALTGRRPKFQEIPPADGAESPVAGPDAGSGEGLIQPAKEASDHGGLHPVAPDSSPKFRVNGDTI
jgi:hypothetical protein